MRREWRLRNFESATVPETSSCSSVPEYPPPRGCRHVVSWPPSSSRGQRQRAVLSTKSPSSVRIHGYPEDVARRAMAAGLDNKEFVLGVPEASDDMPALLASGPSLDAHPLVREDFAHRIDGLAARIAHARLYEHLCETVPFWPEGREGLYVLYDAIAHGCRAGMHEARRSFKRRPGRERSQAASGGTSPEPRAR